MIKRSRTSAHRAPQTTPCVFTAELPSLPPTANHAYAHITLRSASGHAYTARRLTAEAAAWRSAAALIIRAARTAAGWTAARRTPIAVEITYALPHRDQVDLDNLSKVLLDALSEAIGVDDRYVLDLTLRKRRHREPRVLLRVTKVEAPLD